MSRLTRQIRLVLISSSLVLSGCQRTPSAGPGCTQRPLVPGQAEANNEQELPAACAAVDGQSGYHGAGYHGAGYHGAGYYGTGYHFWGSHGGSASTGATSSSLGGRSGAIGGSSRGGFGSSAHGVSS